VGSPRCEEDSTVARMEAECRRLAERVEALERSQPGNRLTLFVFSADVDKLMAAFNLATTAAAMQVSTTMFFTFWSLTSIKRRTLFSGKPPFERVLGAMLASGAKPHHTSRFNALGLGPRLLGLMVRRHRGPELCDLIKLARELGVRFVACQATMEMMGIRCDELIDGVECSGAATALDVALDSRVTLFI
jgi:peroxiredoxin family protein